MEYARHDARMRKPAKEGSRVTTRESLEVSAQRGVASAIRELAAEPPLPECMAGLWERFQTLDQMRDEGMNGPKGFTPEHIRSAALLFDWHLQPHEVDALRTLDLVTRFPDAGGEA